MTTSRHKSIRKNRETGVALIITLLLILVLSSLAAALVFVTNTEIISTANYRQLAEARYIAEAGAQSTVDWLANNVTNPDPTKFDTAQYPVALAAATCSPYASPPVTVGCVYLSTTVANSTYPDDINNTLRTNFANFFNSSANGTNVSGFPNGTGSYTVTAQLMTLTKVTLLGGGTGYLQSWKITAQGKLASSFHTAQEAVRLQVETMLNPVARFAAFGNSYSCSAITLNGNGVSNSYDSGNGPWNATTNNLNAFGDVGSNGSTTISGPGTVNGKDEWNPNAGCSAPSGAGAGTVLPVAPITNLPAAPDVPAGATTAFAGTLTAGVNYGPVSITSAMTIGPGTYYMNSLSISGNGQLTVSPPGSQVTIILASTGSGFSISGNGISNVGTGDTAAKFQLDYNGTAACSVVGNGTTQVVAYAPNAAVAISGNGALMGSVIGSSVSFSGNGALHYDRNLGTSFGTETNFITTAFSWEDAS